MPLLAPVVPVGAGAGVSPWRGAKLIVGEAEAVVAAALGDSDFSWAGGASGSTERKRKALKMIAAKARAMSGAFELELAGGLIP
jgi:hypothetical protein